MQTADESICHQLPEAGRAGRFSSASARNRGGGLLAPPPRVQAREAQRLRSDFFLVRISKSNLWGEGGRNRERGEEDGSLHPSLHPTLRKGELLSLSAERGTSHFSNFWEERWKALQCRLLFRTPAEGVPLEDPTRPACRLDHSHLSDETASQLQPPIARGMREHLVTTGIRGRTSCACSYGGVAGLCSAANRFVLFTERRTGFS